jgi:hypothetical protein
MPADMAVPTSPDHPVREVTDSLARRFTGRSRVDIETRVRARYHRLAEAARITEHLAVLVEHDVPDQLRSERPQQPAADLRRAARPDADPAQAR